jgi:hypothetical protein
VAHNSTNFGAAYVGIKFGCLDAWMPPTLP